MSATGLSEEMVRLKSCVTFHVSSFYLSHRNLKMPFNNNLAFID